MPDLFISYSRKDAEFVRKIHASFTSLKRDIWVDFEDIPLSADWWQEIQKGIDASHAFVFIITPDSIASDICNQEIDYALKSNKRFIPVLHRELKADSIKTQLNRVVSSHNWIYMRDTDNYDHAFEKLIKTVDTDLEHVNGHTRFLLRATEWRDKGNDPSFLLRGTEIAEASNWLTNGLSKEPAPSELHTEYIITSSKANNQRQRNQLVWVSAALLISMILGALAFIGFRDANIQRRNADEQRQIAERNADEALSFALASSAQLELNGYNNDLALALAVEATTINNPPQLALDLLEQTAYAPGTIRVMPGENEFYTVALSPDGTFAVSGNAIGQVMVWDIATGEMLRLLGDPEPAEIFVTFLTISPDGQSALVSYSDGSIRLLDIESGEEIRSYEGGHTERAPEVQFSPDGKTFLSASRDTTLILWDVATGEILHRYEGHTNRVNAVAFSPDGKTFASGSTDTTIRIWNVESGEVECELTGHTLNLTSVAYSADGKMLISGSGDTTVRLWDVEACRQSRVMLGHGNWVKSAFFVPHSDYALSTGDDNVLLLWDLRTGLVVYRYLGHKTYIEMAMPSLDGLYAISASGDRTLRYWRLFQSSRLGELTTVGDFSAQSPIAIELSADGALALTASTTRMTLWDVNERTLQQAFDTEQGHTQAINDVAFAPNGEWAVSASQDQTLVVWDTANGEILHTLTGHTASVAVVVTSPDNSLIASGGAIGDNTVILWNAETGEQEHPLSGHQAALSALAFSPTEPILAAGDQNNEIILWDTASGEEITRLVGHNAIITSLTFNADGTRLASGSDEGVIILWDMGSREQIWQFQAHQSDFKIVFDPFKDAVFTAGLDGSAYLWTVDSYELIRQLHVDSAITALGFTAQPDQVLMGLSNGDLSFWSVAALNSEEIKTWAAANRYMYELGCSEQVRYQLRSEPCES